MKKIYDRLVNLYFFLSPTPPHLFRLTAGFPCMYGGVFQELKSGTSPVQCMLEKGKASQDYAGGRHPSDVK